MPSIRLLAAACLIAVFHVSAAEAQQNEGEAKPAPRPQGGRRGIPSVEVLIKRLDKNDDGQLAKSEIAETTYSRVFSRWDADADGTVTAKEIKAFRRAVGVPEEGTSTRNRPGDTPPKLTIPDVKDLARLGPGVQLSRWQRQNSAFVLKTEPHAVNGERYVVLTDHTAADFLEPLKRLAKHHQGVMVQVADLALLYKDQAEFERVRRRLQSEKVRFLALAPRMESFRENMLLGMWELLTTLDSDPQLDAYPGVLLASNAKNFAALIDRSIKYVPQSAQDVKPFAISQVPSTQELRSLQKSGILRKLFAERNTPVPTVGVYSARAAAAPKLPGELFWSYQSSGRSDFLKQFPAAAEKELENASLLIMHGHGIPGMSCGVDIGAIPSNLSVKVVLCGSCFAASPAKSDLPQVRQAPGGYGVEPRDAFLLRTVDHGAVVAFGHMRLSQGFPHLYPVLENWLKGRTVGEGYQQLLNGIIKLEGKTTGEFVIKDATASGRHPSNRLLYVVFGDPAVQPFEPLLK